MIFWQLFVSYLKIGFFGFGGGYAMLSLIQNEVVVQHAWMTNAEFADIVAVSQITPGPIAINSATYVGYTVGAQAGNAWCGILGAALATFAVCLPSLTLMLLLSLIHIYKPLYFFVGQEHAGLIIRCTFERQKGMTVYPALLNGYI